MRNGFTVELPTQPTPGDPPDSILTLAGSTTVEFKERRSRFIALAWPAASEEDANARIAETARRYHDSRHVCHAWRLGVPPQTRENSNDAGEPSGTAGKPILASLRKSELVDSLVVVVRYFGGIKLGTGGLARAYGQAASEVLAASEVKKILLGKEFLLDFPYTLQKTIRHQITLAGGRIVKEQYSEEVAWRIWLPHSCWRKFQNDLTERTSGSVDLREISD
ncbi:MAG: YigZ family protein [Gemmatimonadales bacterium]|nr:YigZ family protein [Gemmatimonadales bacterium]